MLSPSKEECEEESDEMIADGSRKGSIPVKLVDDARREEQKFIVNKFLVVGLAVKGPPTEANYANLF